MPNVLGLVSFRIYPALMGGQKGVAMFYQHLQKHVSVTLASSFDNDENSLSQMRRIIYPNKKMFRNIGQLKKLEHLIGEHDIDVIIAEHSYTGWMAWWLRKKTGKPFIIHSHNVESMRFLQMKQWWWKLYHHYEGWVHRKADFNFFISREDMDYAVTRFYLDQRRCAVITYGITQNLQQYSRQTIREQLGLQIYDALFLFNGTLDYEPNYEAVTRLINHIDPILDKMLNNYKIIITGNRAPQELLNKIAASKNIIYAGYVEDVNLYYRCADLFLNPVVNDSGVKTKLIEAAANHCTSISTESGASGLMKEVFGEKLVVVKDHDWKEFTERVVDLYSQPQSTTPASFFEYYDWENITAKAAQKINELTSK